MTFNRKEYMKQYHQRDEYKEKWNDYYKTEKCHKTRRAGDMIVKLKCLFFYSNGYMKCANCGYDKNIDALSIDHINDDGNKHRKKVPSGTPFFRWLLNNNFPDGFQILCRNCNWLKHLDHNIKMREC